jgi:hypothetical protein
MDKKIKVIVKKKSEKRFKRNVLVRVISLSLILFLFFAAGFVFLFFDAKDKIDFSSDFSKINENKTSQFNFDFFDAEKIYNLYSMKIPSYDQRIYFGDIESPVYFVSFLDFDSEDSKLFVSEIFPLLYNDYIKTKKMKFYPRIAISKEEYMERRDRFIYAQTVYCIELLDKDNFFPFYFDMFDYNASDLFILVDKYKINKEDFDDCYLNKEFDNMRKDVVETKILGVDGIHQSFYISLYGSFSKSINGVPDYDVFKRTIRNNLIKIGG